MGGGSCGSGLHPSRQHLIWETLSAYAGMKSVHLHGGRSQFVKLQNVDDKDILKFLHLQLMTIMVSDAGKVQR